MIQRQQREVETWLRQKEYSSYDSDEASTRIQHKGTSLTEANPSLG